MHRKIHKGIDLDITEKLTCTPKRPPGRQKLSGGIGTGGIDLDIENYGDVVLDTENYRVIHLDDEIYRGFDLECNSYHDRIRPGRLLVIQIQC